MLSPSQHNAELRQRIDAAQPVSISRIIWLAGIALDAREDALREFCEDLPEDNEAQLFKALPCLMFWNEPDNREEYPDPETVANQLYHGGAYGFLAKLSRPILGFLSGGQRVYSWGHTAYEWVYAESLEQLTQIAEEWAEKGETEDRERKEEVTLVAE